MLQRIPIPTGLLLLSLLGACDLASQESETSTVRASDSSSSQVVVRLDTLSRGNGTITTVRTKLLITDGDTSLLSREDTLVRLDNDSALDAGVSRLEPCTNGLTLYNAYGTEVTVELWLGNGPSYQDGKVTGSNLERFGWTQSLRSDSTHNEWCPGFTGSGDRRDLLVVVGVPPDPGGPSYYLVQGIFPAVDQKSVLLIDELGRLRTLR
ncbi:MAG: hypothetical protein H6686_12540 [Fibrobacteria bacterium]|nr:hypothetical protein [Fibrobacteria bacterium]